MKKILCIGSLNIDYVYQVPHFVKPGETLFSTRCDQYPGGKGLNQSVAIARAGGDVALAGKVGEQATELLEFAKRSGVNVERVITTLGKTGHTIIQIDKTGQNCILLFAGANQNLSREDVDHMMESVNNDDFLLLQNETNQIEYIIHRAKEKGLQTVMNPSPMDERFLKCHMDMIDWLFLNEVEGKTLTNRLTIDEILLVLCNQFPKTRFLLTCGKEGAFFAQADRRMFHKATEVNTVDTTAAGDTFLGYFIAEIARGSGIAKAMRLATAAAAITVGRKGAACSIPYSHEIAALNESF